MTTFEECQYDTADMGPGWPGLYWIAQVKKEFGALSAAESKIKAEQMFDEYKLQLDPENQRLRILIREKSELLRPLKKKLLDQTNNKPLEDQADALEREIHKYERQISLNDVVFAKARALQFLSTNRISSS